MLIKNKPFERQHLLESEDNPNKQRDILTISLNPQERALLEELKNTWDCDSDGTVLKYAFKLGAHVLQTYLGKEMMAWLASPSRIRRKKYTIENGQIVIQKKEIT